MNEKLLKSVRALSQNNTGAISVAVAVVTVLAWVSGEFNVEVPTEVAVAVASIITYGIRQFLPRPKDQKE